jgi:hypothetical protein
LFLNFTQSRQQGRQHEKISIWQNGQTGRSDFFSKKRQRGFISSYLLLDFLSFRLLLGQHLASSPSQNGERSLGTVFILHQKGKKTK